MKLSNSVRSFSFLSRIGLYNEKSCSKSLIYKAEVQAVYCVCMCLLMQSCQEEVKKKKKRASPSKTDSHSEKSLKKGNDQMK